MAFKRFNSNNRRTQLHSLIDMAFILLLFFLVTSMIAQLKKSEQKLSIPTPENEPGRAQILVQFIDATNFLFLDQTANTIVEEVNRTYGFRSEEFRRNMIVEILLERRKFDKPNTLDRLRRLKSRAQDNPQETYFVLIRCPDELPYFHVIDMIQAISGLPNVHYGCVGGSFQDIEDAERIYLQEETGPDGKRRENLVIEFPG